VNKKLKTKYEEKFILYTKTIPRLKTKDKKNLAGKIALARYKIRELRRYSGQTNKELKEGKSYYPAVRLQNLYNLYDEIGAILNNRKYVKK
jgi:hypothetical protein